MGETLDFGAGLKPLPHEDKIRATYLGQAHIAGTGPEGKTCRECAFWGVCKSSTIVSPGHYAKSNKKMAGQLKKGGCHRMVHRKVNRKYPHTASACRLFEPADNVPAVAIEYQ